MLTREDILKLLQGKELNGIRIYIGHEDKGNGPLVRLFMVGCKKGPDDKYHDQIKQQPPTDPAAAPVANTAMQAIALRTTEAMTTEARLTSGRPCPSECGGKNLLNS